MFLSALLSLITCLPMFCRACKWFCVLGTNLLCSSWEYVVTFACYRVMVVTGLAAEPEGAFPMPCTDWAKQGAVQGLFAALHSKVGHLHMVTSNVCCVLLCTLFLVSFAISRMLQGWTQAGMSCGLGCFTLANIRELIQASSLLTAWSTDYFICVMLQGSTKAHELGFLLFTDWFWHFSGVVTNLWLWLREQDCFLIHQ